MKQIILFAISLLLWGTTPTRGGDIFVPPGGSVADALQQAREWRRLGKAEAQGGIRIHLADTLYRMQKPLFIRPEDSGTPASPTVIMGGTLSGGLPVEGWRQEGKHWVAEAPRDGNRIVFTRQLWVNGRKATLARGPVFRLTDFDQERQTIGVPAGACPAGNQTELFLLQRWAIAILRVKGISERREEKGGEHSEQLRFHEPESQLEFAHPWPQPVIGGDKGSSAAFFQNDLALLDEPGEWYQDYPSGRIHYLPREGEDPASAGFEATVPHLPTLVEILGSEERPVHDITFVGTTFAHASWYEPSRQGHVTLQGGFPLIDAYKLQEPGLWHKATLENQAWIARPQTAVRAVHASDIHFRGCSFRHLAATGLDLEQCIRRASVRECQFSDIGGTALLIGPFGEGGFETHIPYQGRRLCDSILVERCTVSDATNEDWGAVGIGAGYVSNTEILGNTVAGVNYSGICVGWGWTPRESGMHHNRIEGNTVTDYARHLYDAGGIYTLSHQPGSTIRHNRISAPARAPYATNDRAFAIYFDEATDGFTVTGNQMPADSFGYNQPGPSMVIHDNGPSVIVQRSY